MNGFAAPAAGEQTKREHCVDAKRLFRNEDPPVLSERGAEECAVDGIEQGGGEHDIQRAGKGAVCDLVSSGGFVLQKAQRADEGRFDLPETLIDGIVNGL